ncbi:MAG: molybdopterin-dependent oxidoreductase [Parvibaculaceae bacterium]|uniref:molybdopterin-containing oxidoreductase family protein n=1 Tax=Thalassospira sp. TaxID=1912094 RepID=UPI0032F976F9
MVAKRVMCASCDIHCMVSAEVPESGKVGDIRIKATDPRPMHADLCIKGVNSPAIFADEKRLMTPLKRVGERGSGEWEEVSWDEALDDIASRLQSTIDQYGPESFAVSMSPAIVQNDSGMARRFMNLVGSPNFISGVAVCMGNTSAVNRLTYGWFPWPDYGNTECIVLFGHDPKPHSWTTIYNSILQAQDRGAKLIVIDPRYNESAKRADHWLQLKPGTDAALCFGWLKVILDEELYDKAFVTNWTHGFEEFRARVDEFPLDRVEAITGVDRELIAASARMYAAGPSVIPWTPITDQQRNSTSAIRLQSILRAICGFLDVPGGETMQGFNPDVVPEVAMELHDALPEEKRQLQLGAEKHPVYTYKAMGYLREPTERVWGHEWVNFIGGNFMAHPTAVFQAMAEDDPYPVRALFLMANNALMSYPNMQLVYKGMMKQDLIVAFDQIKNPSAQLADYILPSDSWLERPVLADGFGWTCIYRFSQQVVQPPGECRGAYDIWKGLADRMGLGEHFPWASIEDVYDHRLEKLGATFDQFSSEQNYHFGPFDFKKYERTGFATPTGKVELTSTVLDDLGFDALPYWREDPIDDPNYPLRMFIGVREDEYFQTMHRHVERLRKRNPEPKFFVSPKDAEAASLAQDDWAEVVTLNGSVKARVEVQERMPEGIVRVPHGWWQPERMEGDGSLSGAWEYSDSQICPDDDDHLDYEQGVPQLKGVACRIQPYGVERNRDPNEEIETFDYYRKQVS